MGTPIPDTVRNFILTSIDSVAQLEALLLLRANPQPKWTCKGVAERIYLTEKETAAVLDKLVTRELIETDEPIIPSPIGLQKEPRAQKCSGRTEGINYIGHGYSLFLSLNASAISTICRPRFSCTRFVTATRCFE